METTVTKHKELLVDGITILIGEYFISCCEIKTPETKFPMGTKFQVIDIFEEKEDGYYTYKNHKPRIVMESIIGILHEQATDYQNKETFWLTFNRVTKEGVLLKK